MLSGKISSFYHFFSFFVDHAQLNGSGEVPHFIFHELGLRIEKATFFFFKKQAKLRLGFFTFLNESILLFHSGKEGMQPQRVRKTSFACLANQSESRNRFIFPAHGTSIMRDIRQTFVGAS